MKNPEVSLQGLRDSLFTGFRTDFVQALTSFYREVFRFLFHHLGVDFFFFFFTQCLQAIEERMTLSGRMSLPAFFQHIPTLILQCPLGNWAKAQSLQIWSVIGYSLLSW